MNVDRRLVAALLVIASFGGGWLARDRLGPKPSAPSPAATSAPVAAEPASPAPAPSSSAPMEAVFDDIYRLGIWGRTAGVGNSGFGSGMRATLHYRSFLQQFMKDAEVQSVVDAGCGDWEFSQAIDWTGIDYKGYDIVPSVIEKDRKKYGKPKIQFFAGNILETDLPAADLLIVKNVLQHLPNADVARFLKQLPKYKHALLVNSVNDRTLSGKNDDIAIGEYRELDLTKPPFKLRGAKVFTYWDGGNMQQVLYVPNKP